jgi:hypothetical protein
MVELAFFFVSLRTTYIIPRMTVYKYELEMEDVNYSRSISKQQWQHELTLHCASWLAVNAAWDQTAIDEIWARARQYILTWNFCEARWIQERTSNLRVIFPVYVTLYSGMCLTMSRTNLLSPSQQHELRCGPQIPLQHSNPPTIPFDHNLTYPKGHKLTAIYRC